jgi:hypothetical protein
MTNNDEGTLIPNNARSSLSPSLSPKNLPVDESAKSQL